MAVVQKLTNTQMLSRHSKYFFFVGIEFTDIPETNGIPLICDMSSNIMTKKFDVTKVGVHSVKFSLLSLHWPYYNLS